MKYLEKVIKYGLFPVFLLPIIFTSRTMYPWHFGKTVLFQILVEILVALTVIYHFGREKKEKNVFRFNFLDWAILAFVLAGIFSAIFGVNFNRSFWGDQQRAQGVFTIIHFAVFYSLLRYFFVSKKDWLLACVSIILIGFASSLLAWGGKFFHIFSNIIPDEPRLSGLVGNPIFFASYLIIPMFLGLFLFFYLNKTNRWRWSILAISGFNLITLFFTQTRGAFLGVLTGGFVSFLIYLFLGENKKTKKILVCLAVVFFAAFGGIFIFNQKSDFIRLNAPFLYRFLNFSASDTTADTRLMAWDAAVKAWRDKPIFGWGEENFQDGFDKHYNPRFLKYSFGETVWDKPHNYFLEILSEAGVLGAFAYLGIIAALFYYLNKIIRGLKDERQKIAFIIFAGGFVAYIIQDLFAFETSNSLHLWFFVLALIVFFYNKFKNGAGDAGDGEKSFFADKVSPFVLIIVLLLVPYGIYKNYRMYNASVLMGDARDAAEIGSKYLWQKNALATLDYKVPFAWEQAIFLTKDFDSIDRANQLDKSLLLAVAPKLEEIFMTEIARQPQSYVLRFWLGQLYAYMGEHIDTKYYEEARVILEEAGRISPERQHIPLLIAKNYLLQRKDDEAIKILEELIQKDGSFPEPHWFLGLALYGKGEADRGVEEMEKGEGFSLGKKNNIMYLINVYSERKEYEKIVRLYGMLIAEEPDNALYYASLAATYAALGDKESVIINLNKAVELDPDLAGEARAFLKQQMIEVGD